MKSKQTASTQINSPLNQNLHNKWVLDHDICIIFTIYCSTKRHFAKIQQTKMLVTSQRFGDWFLFGLVWQYSSIQKNIIKFLFLFFRINNQFLVLFPNILNFEIKIQGWNFFFDFFFKTFLKFWGIFSIFGIAHSSKIPRGPRGIDFIFLDPRGMQFCYSSTPRFLEEWNSPRNCHP